MKISKETQVGAFVLVAFALLYFGFNYLRGIEFFESTSKYYAKYENVGGLTVSNSVSISGLSVGRISKVNILQSDSNKVLVEMTINGDIILGKDAQAILDVGLLGETSIKVEPGDVSVPAMPGDTLYSALGVGIADLVAPVANNIQSTIVRVNLILEKLAGSGDQIKTMLNNLESTTESSKKFAEDMRKNLGQMVVSYTSVINNINSKINDLTPVIDKYGQLADSLKTINVQPTLDQATATMKELDDLLKKIDQSEGTLNALIEDKTLYDNLNQAVLRLDSLLHHMDSRPKDFFAPLGRDKPKGAK